jgi:acetoin utilization protein AcuB
MLVRNWMSKDVITIGVKDSLIDANILMKKYNIRCLPVLKQDILVGIFTDRDLKRSSASGATLLDMHELHYLLNKVKISQVMTHSPVDVRPDATVDEVAQILEHYKISSVPVVEDNKLVGIITKSDIFKALMTLTGVSFLNSVQFAVQIPNNPGAVKSIINIFNPYESRVSSFLTSFTSNKKELRRIYIRVYNFNKEWLEGIRTQLKEKSQLLYIVGDKHQINEIYQDQAQSVLPATA